LSRKRFLRLAGAGLVLGPLTGPLVLGFLACVRARRPYMAGVYALGIVEVVVGLPLVLKAELELLAALR
jgi:hypothetical protein